MMEWEKKTPKASEPRESRESDDFWDVEKLLPETSARPFPARRAASPRAVEVELPPSPPSEGKRARESVSEEVASRTASSVGLPGGRSPQKAPPTSSSAFSRIHYIPPHHEEEGKGEEPLKDYRPEGVLLHRVRVFRWQVNYHYFNGFVEDALRYAAMKPEGTPGRASFFSYFPQYTQLNRRTEAWYLYWREMVRGEIYPETDYAYVLLYLFELINLPAEDGLVARANRDAMARVWMAYRSSYPQLDHYMCEWLCDYCLIHGLVAPVDILAPGLDAIIQGSHLKEFYLSAAVCLPAEGETEAGGVEREKAALRTARILLRHCCQYDYHKSKFASGEHKALFDSLIPAAVAHALPLLLGEEGQKPVVTMQDSTVVRNAYTGALCSYCHKRRLEVSYTSFSRSHELRFLMGDMVKHVENRLRGWIGVRSKLSVMSLPAPLREELDAFLAPHEPPKSQSIPVKKQPPRPAYEALYDQPRRRVSAKEAAAIEAASWETTRILVEAFGSSEEEARFETVKEAYPETIGGAVVTEGAGDIPAKPSALGANALAVSSPVMETVSGKDAPASSPEEGLFPPSYAPFVRAALEGDAAALRAAAETMGRMPDALADEINAFTTEGVLGDILLEEDGQGGYTVISEYYEQARRQVTELLCL